MRPRLRFGVLFDGATLERWQLDCLDRLDPVAELVAANAATSSVAPVNASRAMRRYARRVTARTGVHVERRFLELARIENVSDLDFVLSFVRGGPPELDVRPLSGVWFFAHDRDGHLLPFVREVYTGADVTDTALLASRPDLGGDVVLEEGWFRTDKRSYVRNRDAVLATAGEWPARVCSRLAAGLDDNRTAARSPEPPVGAGRRLRLSVLAARVARRRLERAWERLLRHPQWNVGVFDGGVAPLLAGGYRDDDVRWFPLEGRRHFLADPFGLVRDDHLEILCERFGYEEGKGSIVHARYADGAFAPDVEPAIALTTHMSYPYLVEAQDATYCIPETATAGEVALYEATEFPHSWRKVAVLVPIAALDPTVFEYDGRWWLLCTRLGGTEDVELWAWHAPDLRGPWTPHVRNPIKSDIRSARPAGPPFRHEGKLYRPAQDCSRRYGWRIAIQHVISLTPESFAEETVATVEPAPNGPFPLGRHTLTVVGDRMLVDGHRHVFVGAALRAFLRNLAGARRRRGT